MSHAAVAGLLSLLVTRLVRVSDLVVELRRLAADDGDKRIRLARMRQRARHLHRAIVLSGIATGWMVVLIFVDALFDLHNSQAIAIMFIAAMVFFTLALVFFLREVGLTMRDLGREGA